MENLMVASRGKFLFIILFVICACSSQKANEEKVLYDIVFGDYFNNDTLDFYINNDLIFKDAVLTSSGSSGMTTTWGKVMMLKGRTVFIDKSGKERALSKIKDKLRLKTILNGKTQFFEISEGKGKYLLFFKNNGEVELYQSQKQAILD